MSIYNLSQYYVLVKATIFSSSISMFCSALISIAYICLRFSEPGNSNRVSLRCVFIASISDFINAIFDIVSVLRSGDDVYCRSSCIFKQFTRVLNSSLLMMVGVNLVIVFVLNIRTNYKFDLSYLIIAVIYSLLAVSLPIREMVLEPLDPKSTNRCWYYVNFYQLYGHSLILWMWFYGFLFLSVLIATGCSIISMLKLAKEHRLLIDRFISIATTSEVEESAALHIQDRKKNQSNVFIKVIYRCILYPLVPLLCNIWGFAFQIILIHPRASPNFGLSVIDTTFSGLQGFFLAIVFFSDPTMTGFIRDKLASWKTTYLDEFTLVYTYADGHVEIVSKTDRHFLLATSGGQSPTFVHIDKVYQRESSSTPILPIHVSQTDTNMERQHSSITLPPPAIVVDRIPTIEKKTTVDPFAVPISKVPMRQITTSSRMCSRQSQTLNIRSPSLINNVDSYDTPDDDVQSHTLVDPELPNKAFKPYRYPRFATFLHWILTKCYKPKEWSNGTGKNEIPPIHPLQPE